MLRILAARTLSLILLDAAANVKHGEIVARQLSEVHRSTVALLIFRALRERPQREVSDYGFAFGWQASNHSIYYSSCLVRPQNNRKFGHCDRFNIASYWNNKSALH
jgi:hypothetical protein